MNTVLHETKPNLFIYVNGIIMDSEMSMKCDYHSSYFIPDIIITIVHCSYI